MRSLCKQIANWDIYITLNKQSENWVDRDKNFKLKRKLQNSWKKNLKWNIFISLVPPSFLKWNGCQNSSCPNEKEIQ